MAQSLSAAGYRVDPAQSNADAQTYASTKVFYATEEALPAARAMADGIEGATVGPKDGSNAFTTQLLVVVGDNGTTFSADGAEGTIGGEDGPDGGSTYDGNVVPEKGDAHVTPDLESAREQFFDVELTKLPVMIPQQREESSSYEEAYAYQFSRGEKGSQTVYDAYRLVAKTANGDYWGIQGMTWHDPPILEGPTREVTRRGRTYRLYRVGSRAPRARACASGIKSGQAPRPSCARPKPTSSAPSIAEPVATRPVEPRRMNPLPTPPMTAPSATREAASPVDSGGSIEPSVAPAPAPIDSAMPRRAPGAVITPTQSPERSGS
jgi:hypothetical protein